MPLRPAHTTCSQQPHRRPRRRRRGRREGYHLMSTHTACAPPAWRGVDTHRSFPPTTASGHIQGPPAFASSGSTVVCHPLNQEVQGGPSEATIRRAPRPCGTRPSTRSLTRQRWAWRGARQDARHEAALVCALPWVRPRPQRVQHHAKAKDVHLHGCMQGAVHPSMPVTESLSHWVESCAQRDRGVHVHAPAHAHAEGHHLPIFGKRRSADTAWQLPLAVCVGGDGGAGLMDSAT